MNPPRTKSLAICRRTPDPKQAKVAQEPEHVCAMCQKYAVFMAACGKQTPPFLGSCLPFRRSDGSLTSVCNMPPRELGGFPSWLDYTFTEGGGTETEHFHRDPEHFNERN
jgi:hypothetical protein